MMRKRRQNHRKRKRTWQNDRETLTRPNWTATDDQLPSLPAGEPTSLARWGYFSEKSGARAALVQRRRCLISEKSGARAALSAARSKKAASADVTDYAHDTHVTPTPVVW